jgi:hypothetical protein
MKNIQKEIYLLFSLFLYIVNILLFSLIAIGIKKADNVIISLFLTIMSFNFMMKFKDIKIEWLKYILLFLMAYFALVFRANFVFDFVVEKLMIYYEAINEEKYEELWNIYVNDTSRNFLYIFGLFYSAFATWLNFLILKVLKRIKQKKLTSS